MTTDNVIEVRFGNSTLVSISPKYRYDSGWIMKFVDLDLPESYQVHFGNTLDGDTIEVIGDSNGVEIPDILWTNGEIIYCWLYLHPTEHSSITKKEVRIAVGNRGKLPAGVTPEPQEQTIIDQLITVMNRSADKAEQNAQEAELSADRSEASATLAEGYLASVQSDAEIARTKAQEAESSAVEAEQSETSAQNYAQMSANSASEAQGYAEDLAESVAEAKGYSESAGISAHNAEVYADQAEIAKTEAISGKEAIISAKDEAVLAKNEAVIAKNEAVLAKTDAESAKTASQTAQGLAESARDTAVSAKNDAEQAKTDAESARDEAVSAVASISGALADKAPVITDTASGSIASFPDGADDLPLKSLVVDINPVQDLSHGDPSPENICPISGWTEVDVEQSGKNLANAKYGNTVPSITNGEMVSANGWSTGFIKVDNSKDYMFSFLGTATTYAFYYDENRNYLGNKRVYINGTNINTSSYFADARYVKLRNDAVPSNDPHIQLEEGSTVTPYEPYAGRSITIQLGQTVYGGKLDVLSGELVIDRAMVDLGTLDWNYEPNYNRHGANFNQIPNIKIPGITIVPNALCSKYKIVSSANGWANRYTVTAMAFDATFLRVYNDGTADAATYKIAMSGVQLCYELAEPLTIQLTLNQVNSLLGVNNIWADSGDTEVEYRADTKLFIERLTAPDSADMVADANITSGQYFMVGNSLYKATANIANGAQIIVGTNCIRKSLSEALNEINA